MSPLPSDVKNRMVFATCFSVVFKGVETLRLKCPFFLPSGPSPDYVSGVLVS